MQLIDSDVCSNKSWQQIKIKSNWFAILKHGFKQRSMHVLYMSLFAFPLSFRLCLCPSFYQQFLTMKNIPSHFPQILWDHLGLFISVIAFSLVVFSLFHLPESHSLYLCLIFTACRLPEIEMKNSMLSLGCILL